ncbi:PC-esterase domain-containing protein 1A [Varanus komodoensis]|uniref:PC-esterase domain-containing protein 1A n=1 Tax=Varanus komodoensis TaxID=61221 RepID=UPI001CF7D0D1|nr:PC-esterase domain-containing protein 1A [Varanus komodoensis]
MLNFSSKEARQLLLNKFVVVLGDSIQRSVYKDLVRVLQNDCLLTASQMKAKGDLRFENDHLVEGGVLSGLHNGTHYREVRQYRTCHHLVRFYFLTRVYSPYLESILEDFRTGLQPDLLILNSCVWDISRYGPSSMQEYRANLEMAFNRLDAALSSSCLVIWSMAMPLGPKVTGGFLTPELQHLSRTLRNDVIEGNFYSATLATFHLFDVLDLHYRFRLDLRNRARDGVHWNSVAHRRITDLLLGHVAEAWGVVIPEKARRWAGAVWDRGPAMPLAHRGLPPWPRPPGHLPGGSDHRHPRRPLPDVPVVQTASLQVPCSWSAPEPFSGFASWWESCSPRVDWDAVAFDDPHRWETAGPRPFPPSTCHNKENRSPEPSCGRRRPHLVVRHRRSSALHVRNDSPYRRDRKFTDKH